MITCKYDFTKKYTVENAHVVSYVCDGDPEVYSNICEKKDSSGVLKLQLNDNKVSRSLCLCLDLYVNMVNDSGKECDTRIAGTTINLHDFNVTRTANVDMINFSTGEIKANLNLEIDGIEKLEFNNDSNLAINGDNIEIIQGEIDNYIKKQMHPFISKQVKPSDSYLYHVHAPVYNTRVMRLPGASYYMVPDRVIKTAREEWCYNWIKIALARYNMSEKTFLQNISSHFNTQSSEFNKCISVIAEAACILVHSYTYKSDFVYSNSGKRTPIESFDNIFVTGNGDCEDSSKGIYTILSIFSKSSFKTPIMCSVQRICQLYIPFGVLAEVNNPSIHTRSNSNNLAHMFTIMMPKCLFYSGIKTLPSLLLEGTGRVHCFVGTEKNITNISIDHADQYINIYEKMQCPFYKKIVHLYSDSAIKNVLSYSVMNSHNEYGVDFFDFFRHDFKIKPHLPVDDKTMDICKRVIQIDTPILFDNFSENKMQISSKSSFTDVSSNIPYTDIFTDGKYVDSVMKQLITEGTRFDKLLEFVDNIDEHYRFRIYKQKS